MPKVIRMGSLAPSGRPPAGLKARCAYCGAELETTANEPTAEPTVFVDNWSKHPGWNILCPSPNCGHKVFFRLD